MSELNQLPNGWEWKPLKEISKFENGDRGKNYPSKSAFVESGIAVISATNLDGWDINSDGLNYISEERYNLIGSGKVKKGDILFCLRGSLGKCGLVKDLDKGVIASSLVIVRPSDELDTKLLMYYFNSGLANEFINKYNNGAAQPNLSAKNLSLFEFPLPPLSEQQKIVSKLDKLFEKIDKSIALHQKNIDESNVFMGSVLNDVFGELEEKYPLKKVSDGLKNILTGTTPPKKEDKYYENPSINWFSPSDFGKSKVLNESKNMINPIALTDKKAKMYEKDTLLLVAIGATVGKIGVIRKESSSNQQITAMKFKDNIDVDFSYYWFYYIKQTIINTASAATLPIINQSGIKDLKFIIPPRNIQQKVVNYLDEVSEKIEKVKSVQKEKMDSLKALKASILDKAFRGEL